MIPAPLLKPARRGYWYGLRRIWRLRRWWLSTRVRGSARLRHAQVDVLLAPDVLLGRRIRVEVEPGSRNRLVLGPASRIQDDVLIWLRGGTLELGRDAVLRRGVRLDTSGELRVGDHACVSFGSVLHCAQSLSLAEHSLLAEYVTVTDSDHPHAGDAPIRHQVRSVPTRVGRNVWVGASALVTAGVDVGDGAVVAGHAVVTRDVAPGSVVAGAPARPVREAGEQAP